MVTSSPLKYRWLNKKTRKYLKNGYLTENQTAEERIQIICDNAEKLLNKPTTVNNNNTLNTNINNYENTSLEKLTDSVINKLINDNEPYQIISKFIKELHFNPDIPENHNIYISNRNRNNNHVLLLRNGQWEAENKTSEIENVIYDKETNISDWIDQKGDEYPGTLDKFTDYLGKKYDEDIA